MIESKAAVLTATGGEWEICDLTVDRPREGEILVRMAFGGLCYSDEHVRFDKNARLPIVGGHEGSGVVVETGPGVTGLSDGDHVGLTFVTVCGRCHWCASGRANLCESGGRANIGSMADGTFRFPGSRPGFPSDGLGGFCGLGTFSQFAVVSQNACVKVDPAVPLRAVALVSCGVMTGWGAAVRTAGTRPGDTVVVIGAGGIGLNAGQGARQAGATAIIALDPEAALRTGRDPRRLRRPGRRTEHPGSHRIRRLTKRPGSLLSRIGVRRAARPTGSLCRAGCPSPAAVRRARSWSGLSRRA